MSDFISASLLLIAKGKWDELNRFWGFVDKFQAADQAKLNQAYDTAKAVTAKLAAATNPP
jgi:hypothetical protein